MIPPPKLKPPINKKAIPDARPNRQNGMRFQVNRLFDNEEEIKTHLATVYPNRIYRIIKTWPVSQVACQIELEDEQSKGKKK
jgi:hypothetical protein